MRLDVETTPAGPGRLLVLLFLLLWCLAMPARALVLSASDGLDRGIPLSGDLEIQRDPSGGWRIADVARGAQRSGFVPLEGPVEEGFSRDAVWLRFSLARTVDAPARWLLRVRPPRIHEATLYAPDGRGGFVETPLGDARPFAAREIPDHDFAFPVDLPTEPAVYFLRLRNDGRRCGPNWTCGSLPASSATARPTTPSWACCLAPLCSPSA